LEGSIAVIFDALVLVVQGIESLVLCDQIDYDDEEDEPIDLWRASLRRPAWIGAMNGAKNPSPRPSALLKGRGGTFGSLVARVGSWKASLIVKSCIGIVNRQAS
jgi:hypothetical protein